MTYGRILELANTGKQLPGMFERISSIDCTLIFLCSGENVCVSMFDSLALVFHTKFDSYGREPKVIVATGLNPKIVGGRRLLFLNATSATHLYFDSETAARKKLFGTLPGHGAVPGGSTSKVVHAQKIEPMTISELNQFIITADSQIIEFLCTAKVTGIQQDEGWSYIGCSGCSKKLMAKLTNIQASEAAQIVGIEVDAQVDTELPQSLADIVGKTYTFQLKWNDFNFSSKHQTFTISRIFPQRVLAPKLKVQLFPPMLRLEICHREQFPTLESLLLEQISQLHLMLQLVNVHHRPKTRMMSTKLPRKRHMWNETITPQLEQPQLLLILIMF
ncbi:unnamed protein product [Brassica oleracea]